MPGIKHSAHRLQASRPLSDGDLSQKAAGTLASCLDAVACGAALVNADGRLAYANAPLLDILQRPLADLQGFDAASLFVPDENGTSLTAMALSERCGHASEEVLARRKDGVLVPLLLSVRPAPVDGGLVLTLQDLTRQRALSDQLQQALRMDAIGQLTGGIAHDFNNLLTVIIGHLELLADEVPEDDDRRELLDPARHAARRGADLTGRLLAFARRQVLSPNATTLNAVIESVQPLLERTLGETIQIIPLLSPAPWRCKVDVAQLENALLNLIINSRDAMPQGGTILIQSDNLHLGPADLEPAGPLTPGDYVQLLVTDTGTGMSGQTQRHVFDPFFSTKHKGKGTGLGLSMVYGFIRQSGGTISAYSAPGTGTTMRILLPRCDTAAPVAGEETGRPTLDPARLGRVLVVEDGEEVRTLACRLLGDLGLETRAAANACEALQLLERDERIGVIFADILLPGGMLGTDLAERAQRRHPGVKVLLTSGQGQEVPEDASLAGTGRSLLAKPYTRQSLAKALSRLQ